jgi:hypothetical protein
MELSALVDVIVSDPRVLVTDPILEVGDVDAVLAGAGGGLVVATKK